MQNDRNDRGNLLGPVSFPPLGPASQESDVCNAYAEQGGARHPAVEELVSGIPLDHPREQRGMLKIAHLELSKIGNSNLFISFSSVFLHLDVIFEAFLNHIFSPSQIGKRWENGHLFPAKVAGVGVAASAAHSRPRVA